MIEGREPIHRLARMIEGGIRTHFKMEDGRIDPVIRTTAEHGSSEIPDVITIHAEGFNTEFFTVTITHGRRVLHAD